MIQLLEFTSPETNKVGNEILPYEVQEVKRKGFWERDGRDTGKDAPTLDTVFFCKLLMCCMIWSQLNLVHLLDKLIVGPNR